MTGSVFFLLLNFVLGIFLPLVSSKHINFYRKDYTYSEKLDAFFKLHTDNKVLSWDLAFLACDDEGAALFYPKSQDEGHFIKTLANKIDRGRNVTDIFIGVHDKFGLGEFITVDGHSTESFISVHEPDASQRYPSGYCVMFNIYTEKYRVGPCVCKDVQEPQEAYVCKKVESSEFCPTIDTEYKYIKSLRKCYKINRRAKIWNDAMRTCYMEGGILTVLENEDDAKILTKLLLEEKSKYHVGNRKIGHSTEYFTVNGQKLDGMYRRNYNDQSYGYDNEDNDCGAVYYDGSSLYTITTNCNEKRPFICEMEVKQ